MVLSPSAAPGWRFSSQVDIRSARESRYPADEIDVTQRPTDFALAPPIEPMLAKLATEIPTEGSFLYEPKWDGFRAMVFRGPSEVFIQSRDLRPLDRYFPELHHAFLEALPEGCVV